MKDFKSTSIREEIMNLLKVKFKDADFWKTIECDIAIICSDMVEPSTPEKKIDFIRRLGDIRDILVSQGLGREEVKFLEEEISMHTDTKMISLYEEKDNEIDPIVISSYSRLGLGTEGVIAIPQRYNYGQLSRLTNGVYNETGLVKFYISNEKTLRGKILGEIYEHSQEIPIAMVLESKKKEKGTDEPKYRCVKLFGEKYSQTELNLIKEINLPFFVYRFITEDNKEMILISPEYCDVGDYIISGVGTECSDIKMLTDSARLPTKLPFFFAQQVKNRIIKFRNHDELKAKITELGITREQFFEYPFSISANGKTRKLLQPNWYKWLIWSWLTHQPKGLFNNYPMHLMIMGPKHSGKSLLLNSLHGKSKENRDIFSGSSSTLKSLVPSFKYTPAKLGYLAESNRFSFCDEFFRCLINTRTTKEGSQREEAVGMMNDLLEHQKRRAGSGVSGINLNMTSRIIATTNPVRGIKDVQDLLNSFDESFLSRWLIYYQSDEHVQMIRRSKDNKLEEYKFRISLTDWISILDYLHTFSSFYDINRINEIHKSVQGVLTETLNKHYDARHTHHIECLIDGIVKARCMLEGDMSFIANEEDYENLRNIWCKIIGSWMDFNQVKKAPLNERVFYLPEKCQDIYWKINGNKGIYQDEIKKQSLNWMTESEYFENYCILRELELICEDGPRVYTHFNKLSDEDK